MSPGARNRCAVARPDVRHFYDDTTGSLTYVVSDRATRRAAVIDPVLGFDPVSGRTDREPSDRVLQYLDEQALVVDWILETHAHADHLSAAGLLKSEVGGRVAIGEGIRAVQAHFAELFNLGPTFAADGSQFDHLLGNGERFAIGELAVTAMATPGHTSDSLTYVVDDAAFTGDTLFLPDAGTARCDFPGGDAGRLYDSIRSILRLPSDTRLYACHDYQPGGRELRCMATVAEQAADNIHVGGGRSRDDFVALRTARDRELPLPRLLLPAMQVNIRGGRLPPADGNGTVYLRTPVDLL